MASVDDKGMVTAKEAGTASVIAFVTVNGKTVSDSYPLKVMPDLKPASITVNGKNIQGFNPDVTVTVRCFISIGKGSSGHRCLPVFRNRC